METNLKNLDIFGSNPRQIKRNRFLQIISILLFTLSIILSVKLLISLLYPTLSPEFYEMTTILSASLAATLVASLILQKYQALLENLEHRLGIKADNLNNVINQFKKEREERRHCASDLRVAEEKYRSLVENVSEGILLLDTEGNFLQANKKMEGLLGFSEAELLTMNLTQVFPKWSRSALENLGQTGRSALVNGCIIRKDEQRVRVNFVASKVEYGDKIIIQAIFRDLTEGRQPEPVQAASGKN